MYMMYCWQVYQMIKIFYGPKAAFEKIIPSGIRPKTLSKLVTEIDAQNKKINIVIKETEKITKRKTHIKNLVATTEEYSRLTDSGINSFLSFLSDVNVENMYFQNPPDTIVQQLKGVYNDLIIIKHQYKKITEDIVRSFYKYFGEHILGQEDARNKLVVNLYKLSQNYNEDKPLVVLFYGPTGVGKTETAKYIANLMGEIVFRKQFSMYQNNSFADYVFGANHTASSLARDLAERQSNVILFDEFDKPNNIFYSAFYQLFDEGVFVDKNYTLNLKNSIIICTSNFKDLADVRKTLGDPICSRFDAFIEYKELAEDISKELIRRKFAKIYNNLTESDKTLLNKGESLNKILRFASSMKNARNIDRVVNDYIFSLLVKVKIEKM